MRLFFGNTENNVHFVTLMRPSVRGPGIRPVFQCELTNKIIFANEYFLGSRKLLLTNEFTLNKSLYVWV